jgi:hypothetical protein
LLIVVFLATKHRDATGDGTCKVNIGSTERERSFIVLNQISYILMLLIFPSIQKDE